MRLYRYPMTLGPRAVQRHGGFRGARAIGTVARANPSAASMRKPVRIPRCGRRPATNFNASISWPLSCTTTPRCRGRSKTRLAVDHVFADQKAWMWPLVRTVGVARTPIKIGLVALGTGPARH